MLDAEHDGVSKHLGQIADAMYEWEGPIAEQLELTRADVAAIKTEHQNKLRLQTLVVLSYFLLSPPQFTLSLSLSLSGELHWKSGSKSLALMPPITISSEFLNRQSIKTLLILSETLQVVRKDKASIKYCLYDFTYIGYQDDATSN